MLLLSYLCAPALLFVAFSLTQILIDIYRAAYETALVKFTVMFVFTFLLNALCQQGLSVVSWMIVFIPFIMMTLITAMILVMLGLSPDVDVRKPRPGRIPARPGGSRPDRPDWHDRPSGGGWPDWHDRPDRPDWPDRPHRPHT